MLSGSRANSDWVFSISYLEGGETGGKLKLGSVHSYYSRQGDVGLFFWFGQRLHFSVFRHDYRVVLFLSFFKKELSIVDTMLH